MSFDQYDGRSMTEDVHRAPGVGRSKSEGGIENVDDYPEPNSDNFLQMLLDTNRACLHGGCDRKMLAMRLFPSLFTLTCFTVFWMPVWILAWYIGDEMSSDFWVCSWGWNKWILVLPILYLVTHIVHVCNDYVPNRGLMVSCLFGSCIIILVFAGHDLSVAGTQATTIGSLDCSHHAKKVNVEEQWERARHFYASCITVIAHQSNITFDAAIDAYRLHDCANYTTAAIDNPAWAYLARLEEDESCAGWCVQSQPLWTKKPVKDSCARAVADVMIRRIRRASMQVILYAVIVLVILIAIQRMPLPSVLDFTFAP